MKLFKGQLTENNQIKKMYHNPNPNNNMEIRIIINIVNKKVIQKVIKILIKNKIVVVSIIILVQIKIII